MWTHFQSAVKPLPASERADKGLKLAQRAIAFLQRRVKLSSVDPVLLQGVAMFCETAAVLALESERFVESKDLLIIAEQYRGDAVKFYALRSDQQESNARAEWAETLANLAGATYYAAIQDYEKPEGKQPSRESILANLRKAEDFANRSIDQFKILAENQELSKEDRQLISTLRTTQLLIKQSIEELEKEPPKIK
ncbi:MAG TPA: hypothetical protein VHR27_19020, partial [Blastocatellia bacterium]|nr:hypothetical protein [Blastocatellia bacterium]